jgi:hypothetical protein
MAQIQDKSKPSPLSGVVVKVGILALGATGFALAFVNVLRARGAHPR